MGRMIEAIRWLVHMPCYYCRDRCGTVMLDPMACRLRTGEWSTGGTTSDVDLAWRADDMTLGGTSGQSHVACVRGGGVIWRELDLLVD